MGNAVERKDKPVRRFWNQNLMLHVLVQCMIRCIWLVWPKKYEGISNQSIVRCYIEKDSKTERRYLTWRVNSKELRDGTIGAVHVVSGAIAIEIMNAILVYIVIWVLFTYSVA